MSPPYHEVHDNHDSRPPSLTRQVLQAWRIAWLFIESDILTFVVPNTLFGLASALAGPPLLVSPAPDLADVLLRRAPRVLLFFLYNTFLFTLANQRSPEAAREDAANKPWRPIPSGLITPEQTRGLLLCLAPAALGLNYCLGVWTQGLLVQVLSYYYNELQGGAGALREVILAVSYGLANRTSLQLAAGPGGAVGAQGDRWILLVSMVILTTMHVQDLKDQVGDRRAGRKTLPLVAGDGVCRVLLAVFVPFCASSKTMLARGGFGVFGM
ncbi:hypothetical protein LQW54_001830 [Pestalotiopsis sp. IQ-011]